MMGWDFSLEDRKEEFKRTGNPLLVWDMILQCRKEKKEFPDWVLDYLEDVAEEVVNLSPPKGKAAVQIRDAFGFNGKPFYGYRKFLERGCTYDFTFKWRVYGWVEDRLSEGMTQKEAFSLAGKHFLGEDENSCNHQAVIENAYRYIKKVHEEHDDLNREEEAALQREVDEKRNIKNK